ncbi:MAG: HEPN domain-containing protein [Thermoflexus sp.]
MDLNHAQHALEDGDYDWACFAAHQAAEKAVRGLLLALGGEGWGHSVTRLLKDAGHWVPVPEDLIRMAQRLDKNYIPSRCPNGFDIGAPRDYYTAPEAQEAIHDAQRIYEFCQQQVHRSGSRS